ncbi:MAG: translation initiation factor IF-2 N-terminal domain-containing protein, partial [Mycoplasmatales bacterium]
MAKVRIFEWAKENNQRSNEIVKKLQSEGYRIRNHTDVVDDSILKGLVSGEPTASNKIEKIVESKVVETIKTVEIKDEVNKDDKVRDVKPSVAPSPKPNKTAIDKPKPRGKVPAGGYPPPPRPDQRPGYKPGYQGNNPRTGGYQGKNPRPAGGYQGNNPSPAGASGGYQGNKSGSTFNRGPKPPFNRNRPEPKTEELDPTTTKPVNAKKIPNNKKKKPTYDRFAQFDTKESNVRIDQKTRTQMKKEAAKEREALVAGETTIIKWADDMTVGKFATLLEIPAIDVMTKLFELGIMTTINQPIDKDSAEVLCTDYNVEIIEDDANQEFEFENLIPEYD